MESTLYIQMVNNLNVDPNLLIFLMTLPIVITVISFAKYVMGFKSFGIYVPIIITYMFYHLSIVDGTQIDIWQGLKYGTFLTVIIFFGSYFSYRMVQKMALHYYSKLAIVITNVTIILIVILLLLDMLQFDSILQIDIFSLILIASISERFTYIHASNQNKLAFMLSVQTVILGVICFLLISLTPVQQLLFNYPWIIVLAYPINYFIGRFTGLRLTEMYRFRDLLGKDSDS